jgi:hypothetical protein
MKLPHATVKPRPSAEAVRDPHVQTDARTRHVIGNAAQRDTAMSSGTPDGGDWLAERIEPARKEST